MALLEVKTWLTGSDEERIDSLKRFIEWLLSVNRGNIIRVCARWYQRVQYELGLLRLLNSETASFHNYIAALCDQLGIPYTRERGAKHTRILISKPDLLKLLSHLSHAN
ncbi:MAG: hypothetical protein QW794_02915 [Thermosphaera sp.]